MLTAGVGPLQRQEYQPARHAHPGPTAARLVRAVPRHLAEGCSLHNVMQQSGFMVSPP